MAQCAARTTKCRNCGHRYTRDERGTDACGECGELRRCKRWAVTGYLVCQVHGAGSPRQGRPGGAPRTSGGRYSKFLPPRLQARYKTSTEDVDLLALREEMSLVDARIADLLVRVDSGESGYTWRQARLTFQSLLKATRTQDKMATAECLGELERLLVRGHADYAAWREVSVLIEQRRRLGESERKRMLEMQQYITVEKLMMLVQALITVIHESVADVVKDGKLASQVINAAEYRISMLLNSGADIVKE